MGVIDGLVKGSPLATHTNSAQFHNQLDAQIFNEMQQLFQDLDDEVEDDRNRVDALEAFVLSLQKNIQFDPDVYSGSQGVGQSVTIIVGTSDGVKVPYSDVDEVTVNIAGDTTGGATINGGASPQVIAIANGQASITILDGGSTGNVDLSLTDSGGSGLDVSDTATVSFV